MYVVPVEAQMRLLATRSSIFLYLGKYIFCLVGLTFFYVDLDLAMVLFTLSLPISRGLRISTMLNAYI